jgi:hypothetical protein
MWKFLINSSTLAADVNMWMPVFVCASKKMPGIAARIAVSGVRFLPGGSRAAKYA